MDLMDLFIKKLYKCGYSDRDIRFFVNHRNLKTRLSKISVSKLCREIKINRGSVYHMMYGKRAVPLDILKRLNIDTSNNLCLVSASNIAVKIPRSLTSKLAYLIGVLRDGTVVREGTNEYICAYYSKNRQFIQTIQEHLQSIFDIENKIESFDGVYGVRVRSLTLYLFFKLVFEVPRKQVTWETPKLIEESNSDIQRWYISGFWDAEGGCPKIEKLKRIQRKNLYISFNQKNKESLEFIKKILYKHGMESGKIYWSGGKFILKIKTSSIPLFAKFIRSQHPKKSKRLIKIAKIFSTDCMQPRVPEFTD